jgi:3-phenylpropionate/trans-cinnamate dioxygenase ferredoxin reductase component
MKRVVVVGAALAGVRAATALRRLGYRGELVLVGDEQHAPYDRPPLSKQILRGEWTSERLSLLRQTPAELALTLRLGVRAAGLDLARRELRVEGAHGPERIGFEGLVLATGARARHLPGPPLAGVHVLRTLSDALALRAGLAEARSLVIVGAGFVGGEVASSVRRTGLRVTLVESARMPLVRSLGEPMASALATLHEEHGVAVRSGIAVAGLEADTGAATPRVARVRLADGSAIEADVVLVGIGALPNTEWLAGSGVALDDGVLCDATCTVLDQAGSPLPGVVAAGDVARYDSALFGERIRVEHWTHAAEQADRAAQTLLGATEPWINAPLFWSDQYGLRIQFAGRAREGDVLHVCEGSIASRRFVTLYGREGRLVGALAVQRPAQLMRYRKQIEARARFDEVVAAAP